MSRRARRQRPATPAEQKQLQEFADLAQAAIDATGERRAEAAQRMRRLAGRIADPDNLSTLSAGELVDAVRERFPARADADVDPDDRPRDQAGCDLRANSP